MHSQQEKILNTKDDDVDLFFKSITETVKRFSKKGIAEAKLKVVTLVSELEEKYDEPEISGSAYNPIYPAQDPPNTIPKPTLFTPYNFERVQNVLKIDHSIYPLLASVSKLCR